MASTIFRRAPSYSVACRSTTGKFRADCRESARNRVKLQDNAELHGFEYRPSYCESTAIEYPTMTTNFSPQSALERSRDRRAFLKFLAGSPYIAALGGVSAAAFDTQQASTAIGDVITDPKDALDVMDFEEAAHRKVAPGHWAAEFEG